MQLSPSSFTKAQAHVEIILNGEALRTAAGATVAQLLRELNLQPQRVAVEVNQELAPRTRHDSFVLRPGDRVEVVTLVGGG